MKSMIVLSLIIAFMFIGYLVNGWLQQLIHPRQSFGRLSLYFLTVLVFVFYSFVPDGIGDRETLSK